MRVGIKVICKTCGKPKAPHGRSVSPLTYPSWCTSECEGYNDAPYAGCLWPRETAEDFGYYSCLNATEEVPLF
jgi:hypothetical protein